MPKTIGDILTDARVILNDTSSDRYTDDQLVSDFNYAISTTKGLRPDLFILGEVLPEYTSADLAEDFPLPEIVSHGFVYFLVGNAELRDDEFAVDGRAMTLLSVYRRNLTGSP